MNLINTAQVKKYCKEHNKQISKDSLDIINRHIEFVLLRSIDLTKQFKRITKTEITYACENTKRT